MTYIIRKTENDKQWYLCAIRDGGNSVVGYWSGDKRRAATTVSKAAAQKVLEHAGWLDNVPEGTEYDVVEAA